MQNASITPSVCLCTLAAMAQPARNDLVRRGIELLNQDKPTAVLKCFRQAIAKAPGDLRAQAEYVRTKTYDLERFEEVRAEYEALMVKHPKDAVYPTALVTGQYLTPCDGKRARYAAVARISPDSAPVSGDLQLSTVEDWSVGGGEGGALSCVYALLS